MTSTHTLRTVNLKPCPFCPGDVEVRHNVLGTPYPWRVKCTACGCIGPLSRTEESCVREWNTRTGFFR